MADIEKLFVRHSIVISFSLHAVTSDKPFDLLVFCVSLLATFMDVFVVLFL